MSWLYVAFSKLLRSEFYQLRIEYISEQESRLPKYLSQKWQKEETDSFLSKCNEKQIW